MRVAGTGTVSLASTIFSPLSCGTQRRTRSSTGPGGMEPKYFSTSARACAGSMSPATTSDRLLGV